ncbi:uracil-DNA glycosylase [Yoonia sp. 2307UL14-13]|uniref:uracil-DNA glycosylase n=1 Tax=Yoonia sp. 2307UL14-13 TaxID=3126506 RepID=UPI003098D619
MFDLSAIGTWSDLPFFKDDLPEITGRLTEPFLPPPNLTFAALRHTAPDRTRVVIIGQDPYHTPGKADGLAFSIPDDFGGRLDSLGNIFKEIENDLGQKRHKTSLHDWARQGVLLLNTALTVPPGRPKAHAKLGWAELVRQVITHLNAEPRAYILWGGPAHDYEKHIHGDHLILRSAHPSPLSAHRGFFGSRPFSKVNRWLIDRGQEPIQWADP